jgi:site-specific recombinase XerD
LERIAAGEQAGLGLVTVENQRALVGQLDPKEPKLVRKMRAELRLLHYAHDTETAYIGWVKRFMRHCSSEDLTKFGEGNIKEFLTDLAVSRNVAAKTQDQALAALLFLYQKVMRREMEFIDATRSKKPVMLPVVFSRQEIQRLFAECQGRTRLIFQLLYGSA